MKLLNTRERGILAVAGVVVLAMLTFVTTDANSPYLMQENNASSSEAMSYAYRCSNGVMFSVIYESTSTAILLLGDGRKVKLGLLNPNDPIMSAYGGSDDQAEFTLLYAGAFLSLTEGSTTSSICLPVSPSPLGNGGLHLVAPMHGKTDKSEP